MSFARLSFTLSNLERLFCDDADPLVDDLQERAGAFLTFDVTSLLQAYHNSQGHKRRSTVHIRPYHASYKGVHCKMASAQHDAYTAQTAKIKLIITVDIKCAGNYQLLLVSLH